MENIMLDLETMGTNPDSAVVAIGACEFSYPDGIGRKFYAVIDPGEAGKIGSIDGNTFAWWCTQSAEARKIFGDKSAWQSPKVAAMNFGMWCDQGIDIRHRKMWGNGSDFDNVLLTHMYKQVGLPRPWRYNMSRCFRTLKDGFTSDHLNTLWEKHSVGLTHHNALDDAVRQALIAIDLMGGN